MNEIVHGTGVEWTNDEKGAFAQVEGIIPSDKYCA